MSNKATLLLLLPLLAVAALTGCGPRERRSVVLIVIDTLRQDRLGVYGYSRDTSPSLDAWAARGALADGLSPTSWTKPAVASALTGLHPLRHNASRRIDRLPPKVKTLAEVFQDEGYQTFGMTANAWISARWGFDQGFDELVVLTELGLGVAAADKVNQELQARLPNLRPPFFLYVHYVDPHVPYEPPIAWDGSPLSEDLAKRVPMDNDDFSPQAFVPRDPEVVQAASDLYDGEVRFVDRHVGELLEELGKLGLMESTVTAIVADHGEEFEDHGRMGHGQSLYTDQTRVPMIFDAPGQIAPGTRLGTTSLMDVFPTLLDLAGIGHGFGVVPYGLDGQSQAAVLAAKEKQDGDREFLLHLDIESGHSLSLVRSSQKLILGRRPYVKALFDLESDRREKDNLLADTDSGTVEELVEHLAEKHNALRKKAFEQVLVTDLNAQDAAELKALGYLGDGEDLKEPEVLISSHIRPADPLADGLVGWESRDLAGCIEPGRTSHEDQLTLGWYLPEQPGGWPMGRWSAPDASLAVGLPQGGSLASKGYELLLQGVSFRPSGFRLTVEVNGESIAEHQVEPGPFELRSPLPDLPPKTPYMIVRLRCAPPFDPSAVGLNDRRILGVFLYLICLQNGGG